MRRAGGLFAEITSFETLRAAARNASRGKRRRLPVARFLWHVEDELFDLQRELRAGTWRPGRPFQFVIRDPKERLITAAPFRDRVVHHALCAHIGPVMDRRAIHHSYACRVGKGLHAAVEHTRRQVRRWRYCLKCDIHHFFASVDHATLERFLARVIKDHAVLDLCAAIIAAEAGGPQSGAAQSAGPQTGGPQAAGTQSAGAPAGRGLPIGNLTSQHFANFYLGWLDHFVLEELRPGAYVRYMDDFLLFSDDRRVLAAMLRRIRRYLASELLLSLNDNATLLGRTANGVPFLGLRIYPGMVRLRRRQVRRFHRTLRARLRKTPADLAEELRLQGSLGAIVAHVSPWTSPAFRRKAMASVGAKTDADRC